MLKILGENTTIEAVAAELMQGEAYRYLSIDNKDVFTPFERCNTLLSGLIPIDKCLEIKKEVPGILIATPCRCESERHYTGAWISATQSSATDIDSPLHNQCRHMPALVEMLIKLCANQAAFPCAIGGVHDEGSVSVILVFKQEVPLDD
jgi:hypothetical protein